MLADFMSSHVSTPSERLGECRPKRTGAVIDVVPSTNYSGQSIVPCFSVSREDSNTALKTRSLSTSEIVESSRPFSGWCETSEALVSSLETPDQHIVIPQDKAVVIVHSESSDSPPMELPLRPQFVDSFEPILLSGAKSENEAFSKLSVDRRRSSSEREILKRKFVSVSPVSRRKHLKPRDSEDRVVRERIYPFESNTLSCEYASCEEALPRSLSVPDLAPSDSSSDECHVSESSTVQNFIHCQPRQHGSTISNTRKRRRTRSLNAPSPIQQFGPCGRILKNQAMVMTIQDPASQRLTWYKPPLTVLVIKKIRDASVLQPFVQLVTWLIKEKRMLVFVEQSVLEDPLLLGNSDFDLVKDKLKTFKDGKDDLTDKIDFIVCLGGDGTLLYASLLFQQSVPPVMAFHLGSLGFLTPFQFDNFQEQVSNVLAGNVALTLRSRLRCVIVRRSEDGNRNSKPPTNLLVLNEVVIDRGPSPYLSNIDLFLDGKHITSVQGDGLIVSTPTGSTAYAVAAGASMIHPSVPAIMVTPICPHSLSFRPIVVPAGVELKISVSPDSRNTSWVSFDGRNRQELLHGDSLRVTTSIYPVPSICAQDQISDWFDSLAECLHWNVRKRQKHLDELSDLTHSSSNDTLNSFDREDHVADT